MNFREALNWSPKIPRDTSHSRTVVRLIIVVFLIINRRDDNIVNIFSHILDDSEAILHENCNYIYMEIASISMEMEAIFHGKLRPKRSK